MIKEWNPMLKLQSDFLWRSSSFQITVLLFITSARTGLTAGLSGGAGARGWGGLRAAQKAGLPLISSSFIPSPNIITLSGQGYPPRLWSVYQLLSAARPRMTGWLSWDWWGDVTAAWMKPNQTLSRITYSPASCWQCNWIWHTRPSTTCISMHAAWWSSHWWLRHPEYSHSRG